MKKGLCVLLASLLFVTTGCSSQKTSERSSASGDELARIKDRGSIVIGLEGTWKPFSYHDEQDKLTGSDVETGKAIAEKLGVKADIEEAPWDTLLTGLSTGTYDLVINGVEKTEEREKSFDFTEPYMYDRAVLVVRKDNTDIQSFEDLKGKITANSLNSTYEEIAEKYGSEVKKEDDLPKCMELLKNHQADAFINAKTSVEDYFQTTDSKDFKIVAEYDEISPYVIPLKKGNDSKSLRLAVNQAIDELRDDGTLKSISEKYFGTDLSKE